MDTLIAALIVWGAVLVPTLVIERATRTLTRVLRERLGRRGPVGHRALIHASAEREGKSSFHSAEEGAPLRRIEDLASDLLIRESGCRPPQRRTGGG